MVEEKQVIRNLKKFRGNNNVFLERLEKLSGLTKGYVSKIERMEFTFPIRKRA